MYLSAKAYLKMICELSDELRLEIAQILYNKWCTMYDTLKAVSGEKNEGSPDWQEFHNARLIGARIAEEKAERLFDEFKQYAPTL